jgi:hypothetical protein
MKYRILILLIFLIKCNFLFCGEFEHKDSVEKYNYWAERGVIEVVYAFMMDYIATVTDTALPKSQIKDCFKEEEGLLMFKNKFILDIEDNDVNEISYKLDNLSKFLKSNNWQSAEKNLLQPLMENLKLKKPLNSDFFKTSKTTRNESSTFIPGYNNNIKNWNIAVHRIITNYEISLSKNTNKADSPVVIEFPRTAEEEVGAGKTEEQDRRNYNWTLLFLLGILLFIIGGLLVYFVNKSIIYEIIGDDVLTYLERSHKPLFGMFTYLSFVRLLKEDKDLFISQLNKIKENSDKRQEVKLTSVEIKQSEKKEILLDEPTVLKEPIETSKVVEWDLSKKKTEELCLYFSIPEIDGRFNIDRGEITESEMKFYKVIYNSSSEQGKLFFIHTTMDKRAINNWETYLKPVCDIDNFINIKESVSIQLIKPGIVFQISNNWVIDPDNKVKIKLV